MSRPTPKAFAAILQDAVNEPGTLSQAYRQFHAYSLGNQLLAWAQCAERGLQPGPMATYPRWRELGRQVKKGEKAITLCMPITVKRKRAETVPDTDQANDVTTWFVCKPRWFVLSQTDGEPLPEAETPDWGGARGTRSPLGNEKRQNGRTDLLKIRRCNSLGAVDRLYPHVGKTVEYGTRASTGVPSAVEAGVVHHDEVANAATHRSVSFQLREGLDRCG